MASFQPGDAVQVTMFGKGIVRAVRNNCRYLVEVKGRAMEVVASQLSPIDDVGTGPSSRHVRRGRLREEPAADGSDAARASDVAADVVTLDLHGHTVEQALEALDGCLNNALLAGASELRVIHGRSGGRIKAAVHRRLREVPSVQAVRLDPRNSGVTIVAL